MTKTEHNPKDTVYTTVGHFLHAASLMLSRINIPSAHLDSLLLLEDELDKDRAYLLAHPETIITPIHLLRLQQNLLRRARHEPIAYIRGHAPFYGRIFQVTQDTLIPRPESEDLINLLVDQLRRDCHDTTVLRIADIGTGTGCLGITAALELQSRYIDLYDNEQRALKVAKKNARAHAIDPRYYCENLLNAATYRHYDIVLANLPYVPDNDHVNQDATFEPASAIFGGSDGLELYRLFWEQLASLNYCPRYILTESYVVQHQKLAIYAEQNGFQLSRVKNLAQLFTLNQ